MTKPSIILTGATGLVGSRFVELYQDVYDIHNLDLATGVDITNPTQVESFVAAHPAEAVIHLAAFTDTTRAELESGDKQGICYRVNVEGTANIARVCEQKQLHLIHVSTDFVFDGANPPAGGYSEEDSRHPLGWYAVTKAQAEEQVMQSQVSSTIVRISYPYRANFALKPDIIQKIRVGLTSGNLPPQFSDTTITPTFVDDIAAGFDAVIRQKPTGIYHLTGSSALSPYELAILVARAYSLDESLVQKGSLSEYQKTNSRPFARHLSMNNAKAQRDLGINLSTIDQGLAKIKQQQGL